MLAKYDIVHNHVVTPGFFAGALVNQLGRPFVTSLHNDPPFHSRAGNGYRQILRSSHCVALSKNQAVRLSPRINIVDVIHNGINLTDFPYREKKEDFLLSIGAIAPWKGTHIAVKIAKKAKKKLIIAGPRPYLDYFTTEIEPYLDSEIKYVGYVSDEYKKNLLSKAKALLFPVQHYEPYGVVMIEAMACGTPVIAFGLGSTNEVIEHGKTGFVCSSMEEMFKAIRHVDEIEPIACRTHVVKNFSIEMMTKRYLELYNAIISETIIC